MDTATTAAKADNNGFAARHEYLIQSPDDDTIFREATAGAGKVRLDKISYFMPHVIPANA